MASASSRTFYKDLPAVPAAEGMCDLEHHLAVPGDWCVVIVDIVSSTAAIEAGKYKDVNMVSASSITAVLNAVDRSEIPYIFGGDGATLLVPAALVFDVAAALYGTRQMAKEAFNLDMRAGIVWMEDLLKMKSGVRVGKLEIAPGVFQAALSGDGVTTAEKIVKAPDTARAHDIETLFSTKVLASKPADFRGLECRWQPLQSRNGFDVSLIVLSRAEGEAAGVLYRDILAQIGVICGQPENWRPVSEGQLNVSANPQRLSGEAKVHSSGKGGGARLKSFANTFLYACIGRACMAFGLKAGNFDGKTYKKSTAQNTDYIKFDNALRLIMDVTEA
ncbi:MAG: DUF3095 family protein, partial [Alphaproteobacteria bacterium]